MKFMLSFIFSLWVSVCLAFYPGDKMSYGDLKKLFPFCYPKDSCKERRHVSPGFAVEYSCSCDSDCSKFGTCCIDAPHRGDSSAIYQCNEGEFFEAGKGYFMVHRCPNNMKSNFTWKSLCEEERSGTKDIFDMTPVTSLDTSTTYKNYYCFRCHEATDKFIYWNLSLKGRYKMYETMPAILNLKERFVTVTYNQTDNSWLAVIDETGLSIPVSLTFTAPERIQISVIQCRPYVISDCHDSWTDQTVRDKCRAYTALLYIQFETFKNAHCVLCNFRSLDQVRCERYVVPRYGSSSGDIGGGVDDGGKFRFFPFSKILNFSGFEKSWCMKTPERGFSTPNCKKPSCAIPGYIIRNGICTPP